MITALPVKREGRGLAWAALAYGLFIAALLPSSVIAYNDDFGYLRSVLETLQHGRPWTDDWLAPWSASFSVLAAGLFRATRNFHLATYGLLAGLAAASYVGAVLLLRLRGCGARASWGWAALGLTVPTVLWKTVEFTGISLYFPCLLFALWASERRRWQLFLLALMLGLATRQSAIVWLILPLAAQGRLTLGAEREAAPASGRFAPAYAALIGLGWFVILHRVMNHTHAQRVATAPAFPRIAPLEALRTFRAGLAVYACAIGWGRLLLPGPVGRAGTGLKANLGRRAVLGILLAAAVLAVDVRDWFQWEHQLVAGTTGWLYTKLILGVAAWGWWRGGFSPRRDYLLLALGSLLLLSVRGSRWDYYFLDIGVVGFFGVASRLAAGEEGRSAGRALRRVALAGLAAAQIFFLVELKDALDLSTAACLLGEQSLRDHRLHPDELSFAPFGFGAWYLYPYFITHEGAATADIGDFGGYLRIGAVELEEDPPQDPADVIASGEFRSRWIFRRRYYLVRTERYERAAATWPIARDYRFEPFPLTNAEWRAAAAISPAR